MRVLVTGGSGFLGRNFLDYISVPRGMQSDSIICDEYSKYEGVCITEKLSPIREINNKHGKFIVFVGDSCNFDLLNKSQIVEVLEKFRPTHVLHLAANADPQHPSDVLDNIIITQNLIDSCAEVGISPYILYSSSITIYGDSFPLELPTSVYSISKLTCEHLLRISKLKHSILRLPAMVGPYLTHGLLKDVIRKLQNNYCELELFGNSPGSKKPFVLSKDICKIIYNLIKNEVDGIFTISNNPITVEEVAKICMKELNIFKSIKWLGNSSIWSGDNKLLDIQSTNIDFKWSRSEDAISLAIKEILKCHQN